MSDMPEDRCPYSPPPYEKISRDHIFPEFMGGHRTVPVCKKCNETFGNSFEGRAHVQLKRLQVFISSFGLRFTESAAWPKALTIGDETYDLACGPNGLQYKLGKPSILRDEDGRIIGGKARSMDEIKQLTKRLKKDGKIRDFVVTPDDHPLDDIHLSGSFSFDHDLCRLAVKMASSVLILFRGPQLIIESGIPAYLFGKAHWEVDIAYCDVSPIRDLRPALAHTVYVERGPLSYAIILIFGFKKIYVSLPASAEREAFLASLDPVTGKEQFDSIQPIGPRNCPRYYDERFAKAHFKDMADALTREAIMRNATQPPDLSVTDLQIPAYPDQDLVNGTARYLFPPFTREH